MVNRKRVESKVGNTQGSSPMYNSPCMPISFHSRSEYASRFHPNSVLTYRQNDYLGDVDIHQDGWGNTHWNLCMKVGGVAPTSLPFSIKKKRFILFYVYKYFSRISISVLCACLMSTEIRRGYWVPRNWSNG